jgi:hypothetical protein
MIFQLYSILSLFMNIGREIQKWYLLGSGFGIDSPKHIASLVIFIFSTGAVIYVFYAYREFKAFFAESIEGPPYHGGDSVPRMGGGGFPMPGGQPVGSSGAPNQRGENISC